MRTFITFVCCLLLSGCVVPNYHSYKQSLSLSGLVDTQGMNLERVRGTEIMINQKPADKSQIAFEDGDFVLKVSRSSEDKIIAIVDADGYQRKILLRSQLTNDKWARRTDLDFGGEDVSAAYLMIPMNTIINFKQNSLGKFIICLPFSLVADILNIVILGPSTALINPWYEYSAEPQ